MALAAQSDQVIQIVRRFIVYSTNVVIQEQCYLALVMNMHVPIASAIPFAYSAALLACMIVAL